ncbi:MAG: Ig-like domain-containing protein, partial [Clostridia bacterium]|nr:Ig-like domain-containing protein [Clostridia bacterium]
MKRFVKKIFVITFAVMFLLAFAVGCSANNCGNKTETEKSKITLSANKISLDVFDDYELKCVTENIADDVVWTSSAEDVVSISVESVKKIMLTAKSEGTAKITAKAGDISAICEVEVSASSFSPVLCVGESKTVNIYPDGSFKIPVSLTYKGKVVDADFSFRSQAEDIVSVSDDGVITAKQEGEAIIDITANFKGNSFADNVFVIVKSAVA